MTKHEAREKLELNMWNTLSVGQRLKDAREKAGHTQEEFAYLYGFNVCAVSHWECGRRDPSLENLVRLCHALEVSPAWLLQGE